MIEARNITKSYNGRNALDKVSLHINKGAFYGLLGPNGAGKTTLIHIVAGLLPADQGAVYVAGEKITPANRRLKHLTGVVPQEIALYEDLSALDNLLFWGRFYGLPKRELKSNAMELLELSGLKDRGRQPVKKFSGGMKRRVNLACTLIHKPPVLIMDEPTVGIDPQSRNLIYSILKAYRNKGVTILYTSHYLDEFEKLCDKTGIIDHGKIIAEGSIDELKRRYARDEVIVIEFEHKNALNLPEMLKGKLGTSLEQKDGKFFIHCRNAHAILPEITQIINDAGKKIRHLDIIHTGLESIFFNLTGTSLRDK